MYSNSSILKFSSIESKWKSSIESKWKLEANVGVFVSNKGIIVTLMD